MGRRGGWLGLEVHDCREKAIVMMKNARCKPAMIVDQIPAFAPDHSFTLVVSPLTYIDPNMHPL